MNGGWGEAEFPGNVLLFLLSMEYQRICGIMISPTSKTHPCFRLLWLLVLCFWLYGASPPQGEDETEAKDAGQKDAKISTTSLLLTGGSEFEFATVGVFVAGEDFTGRLALAKFQHGRLGDVLGLEGGVGVYWTRFRVFPLASLGMLWGGADNLDQNAFFQYFGLGAGLRFSDGFFLVAQARYYVRYTSHREDDFSQVTLSLMLPFF